MKKIHGNISGLAPRELKKLQNFYKRRVSPRLLVSPELAKDAARLSADLRRQLGFLIDRSGSVRFVIVGDARRLVIPSLEDFRRGPGRLCGLRLVHTHLSGEGLTEEDLTDMLLLRLDMAVACLVNREGLVGSIQAAHILPAGPAGRPYQVLESMDISNLDMGAADFILELEAELSRQSKALKAGKKGSRAYLVSVTGKDSQEAAESMDELRELSRTAGLTVVDTVIQHRKRPDPRFLLGKGKMRELALAALEKEVDLLVFDSELNPSQIRNITDFMQQKVLDRTQLILDIFAQRAMSREGKLQVELAQLKYRLPRLVGKNPALSRLAGGIGGRGPGETKLEIDRRRARERIRNLEKSLSKVQKHRRVQRSKRSRKGLPVVSIVGYTNAGKSTLLNTLTQAKVLAESRLFATLDPSSRRLRFPRDREIIITDTVGFIKNLPKDLVVAFRATLEELESADLLLHVIDASNPRLKQQIRSVDRILRELDLADKPVIRVLNKVDLVDPETADNLARRHQGILASAPAPKTLGPLLEKMERSLFLPDQGAEFPGQAPENSELSAENHTILP